MDLKDNKERQDVTIEDGKEFVSKTIVGGRPRRRKTYRMNIPAGIEKILYVASIDPAFRTRLLEDRAGTIASSKVELTPSESAVLGSVPDETLGTMIDQIRPRMHGRRRFMRAVAVAAVTLATGTASVACEDETVKGVTADVPTESEDVLICDPMDVPLDTEDVSVGGIMPDVPLETDDDMADRGAMPDVPDTGEED
jgi:hypothetical protein